jgi:hypothetical protein
LSCATAPEAQPSAMMPRKMSENRVMNGLQGGERVATLYMRDAGECRAA